MKYRRKKRWGQLIVCIAIVMLCCLIANTIKINADDMKKTLLPISREKIMYGRKYELKSMTSGGAGIYTNWENDRSMDYVVAAIEEAGIDNTMTDYDKITAINAYLCRRLSYADYAAAEDFSYEKDWLPFTDYCLLSDSAVCAGYAEAFQSMCCALGIECWYVTGYVYQSGSEAGTYHAWNLVILEQKEYYIDTCWNDSSGNAYFLTADGWGDHEIEGRYETYKISGQVFPMPEQITSSSVSDVRLYHSKNMV